MKIKLTLNEWIKLKKHLTVNMIYGGGGTFTRHDDNNTEDTKEVLRILKIIIKIDNQFLDAELNN